MVRFGPKSRAAAGTVVFFFAVPVVVAGLIPWLLTGWDARALPGWWLPVRVLGAALILVGAVVLIQAFARFVVEGIGTPAPIAPTEHLVVGGLYRYVRNPMYLAVGAVIVGQALLLGRLVLVPYAAAFGLATGVFVRGYEEPTLEASFGEEYEAYRRAVPRWRPRLRPWDGGDLE